MANYTRTGVVDPAPGGDSVKQAVIDVDGDVTGLVAAYNAHDTATTGVHGFTATTGVVGGLTHTAATTGFTIAGGTASKTLTVTGDATLTGTPAALGANTFTADQTYADYKLIRPEIKDYGETINAIGGTGGGTQDFDLTLGNVQTATVDTSANTFTFSNPSATGIACAFTLILTNGGSQTVTWPASVDWVAGTAPTLTASGVDVLAFLTRDAGTTWLGFVVGLDVK
jgi:hypothetical protein